MKTRAKAAAPAQPPTCRKDMRFQVGAFSYRLVISDRILFDTDGEQLEGVAAEGRRMIIIPFNVAAERRHEILLHEYTHTWAWHTPKPSNEEERCQLTAFIATDLERQLDAQGGVEALMQLPPQFVPHLGRPPNTLPVAARELVTLFRKVLQHVEKEWDRIELETRQEERERLVYQRPQRSDKP